MIADGAEALLLWARSIQGRSAYHKHTLLVLNRSIGELQSAVQENAYILARTLRERSALHNIDDELIQIGRKYADALHE